MKKARHYRIPTLFLLLVALAGCKLMEDAIDDGGTETSAGAATGDGNSAPSIWGDPDAIVPVSTQYQFMPEAEDADGDVLEYIIVNQPVWAQFDAYSGRLQGVPERDDVGMHRNIVISVTDGNSIVSLPSFAVYVADTTGSSGDGDGSSGDGTGGSGSGDDTAGASSPPSISGSPNEAVVVDSLYAFQPNASDADGDELSFSIVNKPSWASFDTTTGLLQGRPDRGDLGTTESIGISVTDGTSIAALDTFEITVEPVPTASFTLSWVAPTENEDGTPLTNLAGYRIYYGTSPGNYSESIEIDSAGVTSHVIEGITPGTYYLVMTSINSLDMESPKTPELEFQL